MMPFIFKFSYRFGLAVKILCRDRRVPVQLCAYCVWSSAGRRAGSFVWPIWTMIIKQTAPSVSSLGLIRNSWASHSNSLNFPRSINFWLIGFKLCRAKHVGQATLHTGAGTLLPAGEQEKCSILIPHLEDSQRDKPALSFFS